MASHIGRRKFLATLCGAAAWPLAARAQQAALPVVGFLHSGSSASLGHLGAAIRQGLSEAGYIEGKNVAIEYRWADQQDRLHAMASDLVRRQVAVIVANSPGTVATKALTRAIPIVFTTGTDPVASGFVTSLNRPSANLTGIYFFTADLEAKRLGLLHELVPAAATIAVLLDPTYVNFDTQLKEVQEATGTLGLRIQVLRASTEQDLKASFASLAQLGAQALLVGANPFFYNLHTQIITLARLRHGRSRRARSRASGGGTFGVMIASTAHANRAVRSLDLVVALVL